MRRRAQSNLPALAVSLLLVSAALGAALGVAGGAFAAADRDALADQRAEAVADGLLREFGPPGRENALTTPVGVNASALRERVPAAGRSVGVSLGNRTLVEGSGAGTARQLVSVLTPVRGPNRSLAGGNATVSGSVARLELGANTTGRANGTERVEWVRVDGRPVLANRSGLVGTYEVPLPGEGPHRIRVEPTGTDSQVRGVAYNESGAILRVSADA